MNKNEAWEYYKKWMKEQTYSPALKSKVYITRKGWDHLFKGSKSNRRSIKDRYNKFQLIKLARKIISSSKNFQTEVKKETKYYILQENVIYKGKRTSVRVLIKSDFKGKKFFYSVMRN